MTTMNATTIEEQLPPVWRGYLNLMRQEIIPALGCTEPIAVALACAKCAELLECPRGDITDMRVLISRNILKNAMSVIIPGTELYGLEYAAALGFSAGDSSRELEVLNGLTAEGLDLCRDWVSNGKVTVELAPNDEAIYVEAYARSGEHTAHTAIQGKHTHFIFVEKDDKILLKNPAWKDDAGDEVDFSHMSLKDIYQFATTADLKVLSFIGKTTLLNTAISQEGLKNSYGLNIGKNMQSRQERGVMGKDLANLAIMRTTAAIDARMAGCSMPVMSNSGSGNQGITATVPVCVVADELGADEETKQRALIISHLVAIYIKRHVNRLSALCGAMIAAAGVSCAVTYLLGGGYDAMEKAITNMVANITGIICDGAKAGCSLKVYSSLQTAFESAYLALDGVCAQGIEGIITDDVEKTIDNLGMLTMEGMRETDKVILDIMLSKNKREASET